MLAYRDAIRSTIAAATTKLDSDATKQTIQRSLSSEVPLVLVQLYEDLFRTNHESAEQAMQAKLTQLNSAASALAAELDAQVANAAAFVSRCAPRWWPPANGEVLLDICTDSGSKCFNYASAQHVSCGCVVVCRTPREYP